MHHIRIRHLKTCDSLQERFLTQLSLAVQDYNHLVKFSNAIQSSYPVNTYTSKGYSNCKYGRILIEDKHLFDTLVGYGIIPNKSLHEKFPYMINEKYYIDVVRGIFDADGCISSHKNRHGLEEYEFTINGTKEMLESIMEVLNDNSGIKLMQRYPERKNNNYTLKHGGNQVAYKYMNKIYNNAVVYLDRKYEKYLQLKNYISNYNAA